MSDAVRSARQLWIRVALSCVCIISLLASFPPQVVRAAAAPLLISEFLGNPQGNNSPFEYVELVATQSVDFSTSHYSVVFSNNGAATANGWVEGKGVTYGFNITSGSVKAGDVVYVGGSSMAPTGPKLRVIDTATTGGDGFGAPALTGVLGNGGANADGIAVFASDIGALTSSSVPVDAVFFGSGIGTALVGGGSAGYQLPVNDLYGGGKLQATSFVGPDPGSGQTVVASGAYDANTGGFTTPRIWATGTPSDGTTSITVTKQNTPVTPTCPSALFADPGTAASATVSATDADGVVGAPQLTSAPVSGITLENAIAASAPGGTASATLKLGATTAPGVYQMTISFSNGDATPQTAQCTVSVGAVTLTPKAYLPVLLKP